MPKTSAGIIESNVMKQLSGEIKKEAETASTTVWTPGTGKVFVIAGFQIAGFSAASVVKFEDGTTIFWEFAAEKTSTQTIVPIVYTSVKVENKLKIKLTATTTTSAISVWGTEE